MTASRRGPFWRSLSRRVCAALTLVCYLATALNLPLPIPAATRKAGDEPYPCQDHACGCQSAAQCWAGCCCLTPEQRWAWASKHNIKPPDYAERPASASWSAPRLRDREQAKPWACCAKEVGIKARPCCQEVPTEHDAPQTTPARHDGPAPLVPCTGDKKVRWTLTLAALKCRGQGTIWVSTGAALPPSPALTWTACDAPAGTIALGDDFAFTFRAAPIKPPPRS
jgi:hypothetical protein